MDIEISEMFIEEDTACSYEEIGRITNSEPIAYELTIRCPKMGFKGKRAKEFSVAEEYCRNRIEIGASCTVRCGAVRKLKKIMREEQDPYNDDY